MGEDKESRDLGVNRQAGYHYHLLDRFEAGVVLTGTEVKSAKAGMVTLRDSYAEVKNGEVWLLNAHISPYSHGNYRNHEPLRERKLLLHRTEIRRLIGKVKERGFTLVLLRLYLKRGRVKAEIALAKGKNVQDKREAIRKKEMDKEARQAIRASRGKK